MTEMNPNWERCVGEINELERWERDMRETSEWDERVLKCGNERNEGVLVLENIYYNAFLRVLQQSIVL